MIALVCTLFASCMGDSYADPEVDSPNVGSPYGNNDIKDENVITIKELKNRFKTQITTNGYERITEDLKIKAVVTGTDISGNIYNEVPLQDETGAIIVSVAQGGLRIRFCLTVKILLKLLFTIRIVLETKERLMK